MENLYRNSIPRLLIIVPCYNEEEVLQETINRLAEQISLLRQQQLISVGNILLVDDGSTDGTWQIIESYAQQKREVAGLKLVHNSGHQQALWAGLEYAADRSDVTISIDADLQDDIQVIPQMLTYYLQGIDIVYGIRKERKTDTFLKRSSAQLFYKLMNGLTGNVIYNHADFRLISNRALRALLQYPERNLFLRGLVSSLGFPSAMVYYDRQNYFFFCTAITRNCSTRVVVYFSFCGCYHICHCCLLGRRNYTWLDIFISFSLANRRFDDDCHRHYRRIYR